jgi:hypothetical protein
VENAPGVERHGGVLGGGEGEDDRSEGHGKEPKKIKKIRSQEFGVVEF